MQKRTSIAFGAALVVVAGFALARSSNPSQPPPASPAPARADNTETARAPAVDPSAPLPPNHPHIDRGAPTLAPNGDSEPGTLAWSADSTWKSMPNPSSMRLATYAVPHAGSDAVDAELSISRAGGDTDANIARWAGQFEGGSAPVRKDATVHGLKVTTVSLDGTYSGGMGPDTAPHAGWAMLGAIVEASGHPYFFKLTGPRATVTAAHAKFDALVASVTPK